MPTIKPLDAIRRALAAVREWFRPDAHGLHHLPASARAIKAQSADAKNKSHRKTPRTSASRHQKQAPDSAQSRSYLR